MSATPTPASWTPGPERPPAPRAEVHLWLAGRPEDDDGAPAPGSRPRRGHDPVLAAVLGRYLGVDPGAIAVERPDGGKPRLAGAAERLRFNLSHSGSLALVAVSEELEVGVDVQRVEPRRRHLEIAERRLPADAAAAVRAAGDADRPAVFTREWARFEARQKCLGLGVFAAAPRDAAVAVADVALGESYAAAFAVAAERVPPSRRFLLG